MLLKLATKEMLRKKFRFITMSVIIGFITLLVLFLAAMSDGLALTSKEYIENTGADVIVFRDDVDISIPASRVGRSRLNDIARVEGVEAVGPIGFSIASILVGDADSPEKIEAVLIGVEPGMPGMPEVREGAEFSNYRASEVIIGQHVLDKADIPVGSTIDLKVLQAGDEKLYPLQVVGHTDGQYYGFLPSIFVPLRVWDQIRPQDNPGASRQDVIFNVAAVNLEDPNAWAEMIDVIESQVDGVEVTDPVTAYESSQGYKDMQMVFSTQQTFVLLIALLVIGAFFQIQTLQKVGQIGMLKAIGTSTWVISLAQLLQIMLTTTLGIAIGCLVALGLTFILPPSIPLVFSGQKVMSAVIMLFAIGPIAGLASIRSMAKIEPLKAMGLGR